jgi:hypothetical protein
MATSCETVAGAWRHQETLIREFFPKNDPALALTDDPHAADIILIGNIRSENDYEKLRANELIRRFPAKAFVVHDGDEVLRYSQGVLTSLTRSPWNLGRFRSGSYSLFHRDFKNPFIERWFAERKHASTPPPTKKYLASFFGRNCLPLRGQLLALKWTRGDIFIRDTTHHFDNFTHHPLGKGPAQEAYFNVASQSKFILCPRGNGASSIRFFEAMQLGAVPVLISDDWVLPLGPDWKKCILRIPERALDTLETTLIAHEEAAPEMGMEAQRAYEKFFDGEAYVRYLVDAARSIRATHPLIPESWFRLGWKPAVFFRKLQRRARRLLSSIPRPRADPSPPSVEQLH